MNRLKFKVNSAESSLLIGAGEGFVLEGNIEYCWLFCLLPARPPRHESSSRAAALAVLNINHQPPFNIKHEDRAWAQHNRSRARENAECHCGRRL